jgi:c-di-GMP-binding flagellar brake protein YcgR
MESREHPRYAVAIAAEIEADGDTLIAATRDISDGGVAVVLNEPLDEGSTVELALILTQDGIEDATEDPFAASANVMWTAPTADGRAMVGLRFVQVAAPERKRLERFLSALARAGAH